MQNLKKSLLISILTIFSFYAQAQSITTYSPYSRYGIGQIPTYGFAGTKAMGGISQAVRNPYGINYLNPASYTAQDTMSFILDFGVETGGTKYESQGQTITNGYGGMHHLAISFPITKWWGASLGLAPYSQVGYLIKHYETDSIILSSIGRIKYYNKGDGGINQVYLGNAFKIFDNLSVGFNLSYFFGSLNYTNSVVFPSNASKYYNTNEKNSIVVSDIAFRFGAQYTKYFNTEKTTYLIVGASIDNETKIRAKRKYLAEWYYSSNSDTISFKDSTYGNITFPRNISVGVSYNYKDKIFASAEYSTQNWEDATFFNNKQQFTNSNTYRFGFEYTPNRTDLKNYYKHISYRVGMHFTNSYLELNNHKIKEFGLSAGLGFPFKSHTKFNVSYEYLRRGTTQDGLIRETSGIVNFSLTFYDFWFIKRKYN